MKIVNQFAILAALTAGADARHRSLDHRGSVERQTLDFATKYWPDGKGPNPLDKGMLITALYEHLLLTRFHLAHTTFSFLCLLQLVRTTTLPHRTMNLPRTRLATLMESPLPLPTMARIYPRLPTTLAWSLPIPMNQIMMVCKSRARTTWMRLAKTVATARHQHNPSREDSR